MFYEMKDKRVETGTQTRWWLTAAFSGVVITASFIGVIFWLGITVRQADQPNHERHPSFRDYHRTKVSKPTSTSSSSPPSQSDDAATAAEILKTTLKHKKARVEMVDNSGEKFTLDRADSSTKKANGNAAAASTKPNTDEYGENDSPDHIQLRSKIAKLSSMQEYDSESDDKFHFRDGVSPLEEHSPESISATAGGSENNSVKKKSEAVLPSWYDQNLHNTNPSKSEPANDLKQDTIYDLPDFSVIKPDLSAFNTKTIPAFTYLKEPLPHFEDGVTASANSEIVADNADDSVYFHQQQQQQQQQQHHHHHHVHHPHQHPPHYHLQQQYRQPSSSNSVLNDKQTDDDEDDNSDHGIAFDALAATATAAKDDNSLMNFLQKRLQNVHDWLLYGGKKNRTVDIMEVVKMVNNSFHTKNVGAIFSKLKDLYARFNTSDVQNMPVSNLLYPTSPSLLSNSTSLVSFGLLAIDLFLLHNVQQIVWNEESHIGDEMLKDPDVVALNALFMSPDRVQQLRQTNSRIFTGDTGSGGGETDKEKKNVVHDLLEFVNGGLRAVLNLSKAYKSSVSKSSSGNARSRSNGSTLDCIWTLYCRNLDKTAKLHGPYGFLAKMNRGMPKIPAQQIPSTTQSSKTATKDTPPPWTQPMGTSGQQRPNQLPSYVPVREIPAQRNTIRLRPIPNSSPVEPNVTILRQEVEQLAGELTITTLQERINRIRRFLGLRLMMGEFPVEKALDRLMKEYNSGWGPLDCDKLFPRCNAEEAKEIVIQTALGRSTF